MQSFKYYKPQKKCGLDPVSAAITGGAGLVGDLFGFGADMSANATNSKLQQAAMEQQERLFHEGNEFNAAEAQKARDFNMVEAQKTRDFQADQQAQNIQFFKDYNDPSAQVQRNLAAGINPATLAGNMGNTPAFSTPAGASATASPASAASAPSVPMATMRSGGEKLQDIGNIFGRVLGDQLKQKEMIKADTFNRYYDQILAAGLDVSKEQAKVLRAEQDQIRQLIDESRKSVEKMQQEIDESLKRIGVMDKQGKILDEEYITKHLENVYKDEQLNLLTENLRIKNDIDSKMAKYYVYELMSRVAANYGTAAAAHSQARLNDALKDLTPVQRQVAEETRNYYEQLTNGQIIENRLNNLYGADERKVKLKGLEFDNSVVMKGARFLKEIAVPIATGIGIGMMFKGKPAPATTKVGSYEIIPHAPINGNIFTP